MFGFKKKGQTKTKTQTERVDTVMKLTYKQSHSFKGFKRIKLASYGHKPSQDGIAALSNVDISDATITVKVIQGEHSRAEIYVNDTQVGSIWPHSWAEYYDDLKNSRVDKVMARIDDDEAYLFIHRVESK